MDDELALLDRAIKVETEARDPNGYLDGLCEARRILVEHWEVHGSPQHLPFA